MKRVLVLAGVLLSGPALAQTPTPSAPVATPPTPAITALARAWVGFADMPTGLVHLKDAIEAVITEDQQALKEAAAAKAEAETQKTRADDAEARLKWVLDNWVPKS